MKSNWFAAFAIGLSMLTALVSWQLGAKAGQRHADEVLARIAASRARFEAHEPLVSGITVRVMSEREI